MKKKLQGLLKWWNQKRYTILITKRKDGKYIFKYSKFWGLSYTIYRKYNHIHGNVHQYWYDVVFESKKEAERAISFYDTLEKMNMHRDLQRLWAKDSNNV